MKYLLIFLFAISAFAADPLRVKNVASSYTATKFDDVVNVDASGGARTITPPLATASIGKSLTIRKTDASANFVTIGATVEGITQNLLGQFSWVTIESDGSNWLISKRSQPKVLSWSGGHSLGCNGWVASGGPVDPPDDSTGCTLNELTNSNFGTVVTYGAAKPGFMFTPKTLGSFWVCAGFALGGDTASAYAVADLTTTDGAFISSANNRQTVNGLFWTMVQLCGTLQVNSFSQKTIRIRLGSGTAYIVDNTPSYLVHWSIHLIGSTPGYIY